MTQHSPTPSVIQSFPTLCDPMDYSSPASSVELARQEYWCGLPFSSPGDLPDPGIETGSPALKADYSGKFAENLDVLTYIKRGKYVR